MLKCGYCGRENPDQTQTCCGCGTPFIDSSEAGAGVPALDRPISDEGIIECALGLVGLLAGHIFGIIHLACGLTRLHTTENADAPYKHLERAARLESINRRAAVALYERIVQNYPGTGAAEEANRNLRTLRVAYHELTGAE